MTEQEEFEFRARLEQEQAQRYATPPILPIHTESSSSPAPRQPSQWSDVPAGAWKGVSDLGFGMKQRAYELAGSPEADKLREQVVADRAAAEKEALLKGPPSLAFGASEIGAKTLPFMAASAIPGGQTLPGAALIGAAQGALEPTASSAETGRNVGLSGISAFLTSLGLRGLAPRAKIEPERQYVNKAADFMDVPLTGGQRTGLEYVQQAEGHALWNPLTRLHARSVAREQEDNFVRSLLKKAGVPDDRIPAKPSLSPAALEEAHKIVGSALDYNFVGQTYTPADLAGPFQVAMRAKYFSAASKEAETTVRRAADIVLQLQRTPRGVNNFQYRGESIQELLRELKGAADWLYTNGHKRAGDLVKGTDKEPGLLSSVVGSLKSPTVYRIADQSFAKLKVLEETLRRSEGMGMGNPDPRLLGRTMEREMPGSVIRNRSDMADLARTGEAVAQRGQPLPERVGGLPRFPSDFHNAATYYRFNNPLARAGFRHPTQRDMLETALRYLPYSTGQSDVTLQEVKKTPKKIKDWWNEE